MEENRGLLVVVSGASGTGKGTVLSALLQKEKNLGLSVSATTRNPRKGERDGKEYYFLSEEKFEQTIADGGFLEWAKVYGNYYGTPLNKVEERLSSGEDVLLEIDTQGALQVMEKCPWGVYIFILPPSLKELARRIKNRGTEDEESLKLRQEAAKKEIALAKRYGYVVVNHKVEDAVKGIEDILAAERSRAERNLNLIKELTK